MSNVHDPHFKNFAKSLTRSIGERRHDTPEERTARQQKQVDGLIDAEDRWRKALLKHRDGRQAYEDFFDLVIVKRRNILTARPFFRERQEQFAATISDAIKHRDVDTVSQYRVNFQFVHFVMVTSGRTWEGRESKELNATYKELKAVRSQLMEENLPLCINRAFRFWKATPRSHLEYMDLVQIATEGLANAIDKFVPPYTPVIRSVMIGRMVGNFIESYTTPMLHFYPSDKRLIYRANKATRTVDPNDFEEITRRVNTNLTGTPTNPDEIQRLTSAASHISTDFVVTPGADDSTIEAIQTAAPASHQPDHQVEYASAMTSLAESIEHLDPIEKKILAMKGIDL